MDWLNSSGFHCSYQSRIEHTYGANRATLY